MLRSMTGFGRCNMDGDGWTQSWEIRSVNGRHLDLKWRLPLVARGLEGPFEKTIRRFASRGRVDVTLNVQFHKAGMQTVHFNALQASAMLDSLEALAKSRKDKCKIDYSRLLGLSFLWEDSNSEPDESFVAALQEGLAVALKDWNKSRGLEANALAKDMLARIDSMEAWVALIEERAPSIKEERFAAVRDRLNHVLESLESNLEEGRFLQEVTLMADKLDVSEELTRLHAHLERLRELLADGRDAGKRLDFTLQECFREINTCGNKIQDAQLSRIVVDFKNELEKCREQVQNME
ncbi:MAG: YicC/YloC family endoribonuclease [Pseudomonadota bacterium]